MKIFILLFFLLPLRLEAQGDKIYITTTYYGTLGEKFRVETASSWPSCKELRKARKLYLDGKNELREIAIWRANGKMEEAGMLNLYKLSGEVDAIFDGASDEENPCTKDKSEKSSDGAQGSYQ